ncbi:aspartate aminotransferase family protein [Puteibacter caeruleilacunae]|nr:aspartate aminotransferase family protein [Puteibacter caeruleilacunae]
MKKNIIPLYPSSEKILEESQGCYQYDTDGKKYIDFESGVWCVNLGHSRPRIVDVIQQQSRRSIHQGYRFRNAEAEQLSTELQRIIGFDGGASVFLSSGSEAVNLSITMAQKLTGRKKILKISNSYLSAYGFGQITPDNEYVVCADYNNMDALDDIDFSEISALLLETGGASVGIVRFPSNEYVRKLIALCETNGCLVIAEEVTTGMGRQGKWFGFQNYEARPDMVVTGKGLGNGYPISAVTINSDTLDRLNDNLFVYAQSHQNDPLGCAIALEVIKVMEEEKVLVNCLKMGTYFEEQLQGLKSAFPVKIKEVRAMGLMLALEFQDSFDSTFINEGLFESGFVFGYKLNTLRFLPPLVITEKEIDELIGQLNELLEREGSLP